MDKQLENYPWCYFQYTFCEYLTITTWISAYVRQYIIILTDITYLCIVIGLQCSKTTYRTKFKRFMSHIDSISLISPLTFLKIKILKLLLYTCRSTNQTGAFVNASYRSPVSFGWVTIFKVFRRNRRHQIFSFSITYYYFRRVEQGDGTLTKYTQLYSGLWH